MVGILNYCVFQLFHMARIPWKEKWRKIFLASPNPEPLHNLRNALPTELTGYEYFSIEFLLL